VEASFGSAWEKTVIARPPPQAFRPPRVFVVDDDEATRDSLMVLLETHGIGVRAYASGAEILSDLAAVEGGCLLLDIRMPSQDGFSVLQALRERGVRLPAIICTGAGGERARREAEAAGAAYIEKPVDGERLVSLIAGTSH
jgi:two-component system response regulator FixJ